jgi:hypothetical protein
MERQLEVMIGLMEDQLKVQTQILKKLVDIENNLPAEFVSTSLERKLNQLGEILIDIRDSQ